MKDVIQLFKALRNTQPKFDYFTGINPAEFVQKNIKTLNQAVERCEMTGVDIGDMIEVAKKLLPTLPYVSSANYFNKEGDDPNKHDWLKGLEQMGSKADRKWKGK